MINRSVRRVQILLAVVLVFAAQAACNVDLFGDDTVEQELFAEQTSIAFGQVTVEEPERPPDYFLPPVSLEGLPEISRTFSAENMMDLPVYRANFTNPIQVDDENETPFSAFMNAEREDDLQKLGGSQPGTVHQVTRFDGSYDPDTEILAGTLTHQYVASGQATEKIIVPDNSSSTFTKTKTVTYTVGGTLPDELLKK